MTTNSQLSTTEPKNKSKNKLSKQLNRNRMKWRSHGGLSIGECEGERGERYRE